jgi:peroxiredoxin
MSENTQIIYARGRFDGLLLLLLSASLIGNVALGYRLLGHNHSRNEPDSKVTLGTRIDALALRRLDGSPERIRFGNGQSPAFLYIFTPSCKWCERNLGNLLAVSAAAKERGLRVIGISLDPVVDDYIRTKQLTLDVYVAPTETIRQYGLGVTPETFVLSADGRVEHHWIGAYSGGVRKEVESWLGRPLPEVEPSTQEEP